jgi:hypothetical protein
MFFDSKGFRSNPDPFEPIEAGLVGVPSYKSSNSSNNRVIQDQHLQPLHGSGDYRPKCASNIPPEIQAASRKWMTNSAEEIIQLSRKRHEARFIDLQKPYNPVSGPGHELIVECNTDRCAMAASGDSTGIGIYRREKLPVLPGTWSNAYGFANSGRTPLAREEGGRNTRRG